MSSTCSMTAIPIDQVSVTSSWAFTNSENLLVDKCFMRDIDWAWQSSSLSIQ